MSQFMLVIPAKDPGYIGISTRNTDGFYSFLPQAATKSH